jgi:predicted esterase
LVLPKDLAATEQPPLIFLWHWLGGDAQDFLQKGEIQAAVDSQRFIAVMPEKKGDLLFVWPVEIIQSQARVDEELKFFDDMLACVSAQMGIDKNCVSSGGVSAGALWTDQLAAYRSEYLASFLSLSGGVGGVIRAWGNPQRKLPGMVLWGGPTDTCGGLLSFNTLSANLEKELEAGDHFFLECVHNCGHSEPPMVGAAGFSKYQALWQFATDHPFWLPKGESPYLKHGVPKAMPEWCGIGKGSATPKTGACTDPSQC